MDIDQTFNEGLPSDCSDENLNAAKFAVPDRYIKLEIETLSAKIHM